MTLEEALVSYLKPVLGNRVYPDVLPRDVVLPAVSYTTVSVIRAHALQNDPGFVKHRVQFTYYAKTLKQAKEAARSITKLLRDFRGQMSDVFIQSTLIQSENSRYENDTKLFSVVQEFEFQYDEEG